MTKRTPSPEPPPTINDICTGDVGGELLLFLDPRALCRCEAICRTWRRRLPPARRSAEVYLQRRVAILEKQVKSLRLAAGALAEAAYLGDTLEPSDSEDEMEAESDLDNGDEEITDLVSDGEGA